MTGVTYVTISGTDADMRLDRWFHREFPHVGHGHLSRLLRTGQVRLDGARCRAGARLAAGQVLRLPPLPEAPATEAKRSWTPEDDDLDLIRERVIHRDDSVLAVDKPAGLAVQGGTGLTRHLDAMLDGLRFGSGERPRLVHRLDKATSGVLVLARTAPRRPGPPGELQEEQGREDLLGARCRRAGSAGGRADIGAARQEGRKRRRARPDRRAGRPARRDDGPSRREGGQGGGLAGPQAPDGPDAPVAGPLRGHRSSHSR